MKHYNNYILIVASKSLMVLGSNAPFVAVSDFLVVKIWAENIKN